MDGPFSDTPYTQLSLFPTVEEQVERIAQTVREEIAPPVSPMGVVPEQAVERILSAGTNDPVGALRIYAQYQAGVEAGEMAASLRQEFSRGGRGFTIDGVSYALWFDENGLAINSGKSARYDRESLRLSWTEAESRIRRLVENGSYLSPERAAKTWDNEAHELAESLWYLRQDFGEPALEAGLLPLVNEVYMERGGFPEATKKLEAMLQSPEKTAGLAGEMGELCAAYAENPDILRFHFHRPPAVLKRLERLQTSVKVFPLTEGFREERPAFITEDEVNEAIAPGGSYSDSKLAAYVFFRNHPDRKERQEYLKESFGIGGGGSLIRDTWHDAKGFKLKRTFEEPYAQIMLNWNQVERRMDRMMETGRFLTPEDQARFPEYEKFILSRDVNAFFYYGAKGQRPYEEPDFGKGWETVRKWLDHPAQVDTLLSVMKDGLQSMAVGQRGYEVCVNAYDSLSAYKDGTYSLLGRPGPAPAKETVSEAGQKEPGKNREKQRSVNHEKHPQDAAKSTLNRLKSQSRKQTREEHTGQLTFDFSGGTVSTEEKVATKTTAEPEAAHPTLRDLYHQYQPVVLSQVFEDSAFFHALKNSDEQNLLLECDAAIQRAVLSLGETELTKAYFDTPQFHNRLHREILAEAKESLSRNPRRLYEAALPELVEMVKQSEIYPFLRDRDTDVLEAQRELYTEVDNLLAGLKDKRPALHEAYTTLPDFREYLVEDILERTYQDVTVDSRTSVEQHEKEANAPVWVRDGEKTTLSGETAEPEKTEKPGNADEPEKAEEPGSDNESEETKEPMNSAWQGKVGKIGTTSKSEEAVKIGEAVQTERGTV